MVIRLSWSLEDVESLIGTNWKRDYDVYLELIKKYGLKPNPQLFRDLIQTPTVGSVRLNYRCLKGRGDFILREVPFRDKDLGFPYLYQNVLEIKMWPSFRGPDKEERKIKEGYFPEGLIPAPI